MKKGQQGFTLIELLIVVAIIGIIAAIAIPNLLNAIDRGKQTRSIADMRNIGTAVETYAVDNSVYPVATTAAALKTIVETNGYIKVMPTADGWGNAFLVDSIATGYTIFSAGKDGTGTTCTAGTTTSFNDEICLVNGSLIRRPQGAQN
jgi:type II secretion system protein G